VQQTSDNDVGLLEGKKVLMEGNEAIAEAAILAGCHCYFGYPITPQTQLLEYMARKMPELGRVFVQAESEVASINMVFGAAAAGMRAMTSSSSPGISLMQEGISYITAAQLPAVIVNVMRGGPGLGGIAPGQADYFQATKPGHGDYHTIVLAPASVQEAIDLTMLCFELSDKYRNPAVLLADGLIGQIMEPVVLPEAIKSLPEKPWALTGARGREKNVIKTLALDSRVLEQWNIGLQQKYDVIRANEVRFKYTGPEESDIMLVAYGVSSRICQTAIELAEAEGVKCALFRPISLFPFPYQALQSAAARSRAVLTVELSAGQLVEDVRLAAQGTSAVYLHPKMGGELPTPEEIAEHIVQILRKVR
jgi:2-oxoglutarate/2-oxoacid ferredoxin oxidoreductase subunit alpha